MRLSETVTVRMSKAMKLKLLTWAKRNNRTLSGEIVFWLNKKLEEGDNGN